ncbi:hypothetical protein [Pseudooceanicola aestuarii]|uniref:hypothetical protein n=1 Tax=Pseudooceanicola aestuarii TaxID=2697319 RepID=UPI0013CF9DFE|nr:hypothetical protein [Pseudooceanicola aestuarii]
MTTTLPPAATEALTDLALNPIRDRLGLKDGDLKGAALAGKRALDQGQALEALNIFRTLVLLDPLAIDPQIGLAEAALAGGLNELAMQCASVVVAQAPRRAEGYLLSGRAAMAMGETDVAQEDLAEAQRHAEEAGATDLAAEARNCLARLQDAV